MQRYRADKASMRVISLSCVILYTACSAFALMFLRFVPSLQRTVLLILLVALLLICLVYLPLYYRSMSVYITASGVMLRTGVLRVMRRHMKAHAIQYITTVVSPLSRYTGLNFIIIRALGGRIIIPFLSRGDAEEILHILTAMAGT